MISYLLPIAFVGSCLGRGHFCLPTVGGSGPGTSKISLLFFCGNSRARSAPAHKRFVAHTYVAPAQLEASNPLSSAKNF